MEKFDGQKVCFEQDGVNFEIGPKGGAIASAHYHDDIYQIDLMMGGSCVDLHAKHSERAHRGQINIYNPSDPHRVDYQNAQSAIFAVTTEKMERLVRSLGCVIPQPSFSYKKAHSIGNDIAEADVLVRELWDLHFRIEKDPNDKILQWCNQEKTNLLLQLFLRNLLGKNLPTPSDDSHYHKAVLERVCDWIRDNYADPELELSGIAKVAGLSDFHFSRVFKKHTGVSPHHYLQQVRVQRAKEKLARTKASLTDVALSTGFNSTHQLNYHFKSTLGYSPKELRKARRISATTREYA